MICLRNKGKGEPVRRFLYKRGDHADRARAVRRRPEKRDRQPEKERIICTATYMLRPALPGTASRQDEKHGSRLLSLAEHTAAAGLSRLRVKSEITYSTEADPLRCCMLEQDLFISGFPLFPELVLARITQSGTCCRKLELTFAIERREKHNL